MLILKAGVFTCLWEWAFFSLFKNYELSAVTGSQEKCLKFSNEQLNEEQFSNEGFEQSDEFGDEQFNDNNASSGEFPLSDDEEFQDNIYTSEDENAVPPKP